MSLSRTAAEAGPPGEDVRRALSTYRLAGSFRQSDSWAQSMARYGPMAKSTPLDGTPVVGSRIETGTPRSSTADTRNVTPVPEGWEKVSG